MLKVFVSVSMCVINNYGSRLIEWFCYDYNILFNSC